jgi:hypothetical protein
MTKRVHITITVSDASGEQLRVSRPDADDANADLLAGLLATAIFGRDAHRHADNSREQANWTCAAGLVQVETSELREEEPSGTLSKEELIADLARAVEQWTSLRRDLPTELHLRMGRASVELLALGLTKQELERISYDTGYSGCCNAGVRSKQQTVYETWIRRFGFPMSGIADYGLYELYTPLSRRRKPYATSRLSTTRQGRWYLAQLDSGRSVENVLAELDGIEGLRANVAG